MYIRDDEREIQMEKDMIPLLPFLLLICISIYIKLN